MLYSTQGTLSNEQLMLFPSLDAHEQIAIVSVKAKAFSYTEECESSSGAESEGTGGVGGESDRDSMLAFHDMMTPTRSTKQTLTGVHLVEL